MMFRALKYLKVPTVMVRFPGETHELSRSGKPRHRIERLQHIVGWFDKCLQGAKLYETRQGRESAQTDDPGRRDLQDCMRSHETERREFLDGGAAMAAAPFINRHRYRLGATQSTTYSKRAIDLVRRRPCSTC